MVMRTTCLREISCFFPSLEGVEVPQSAWNLFALIDPVLGEHETFLSVQTEKCASLEFGGRVYPKELRPYLAAVTTQRLFAREKFVQEFIEHATREATCDVPPGLPRARRYAALILTPIDARFLSQQLGLAAQVFDSKKVGRILRYWDPRVAQHQRRNVFLTPTRKLLPSFPSYWWLVDANGHLMEYAQTEAAEFEPLNYTYLDPSAEEELAAIGEFNACFERVGAWRVGSVEPLWRDVRACLQAAQEAGLRGIDKRDDRILFASHRWKHNEPIEMSSRMKEMLSAIAHGASYSAMQADLDECDWVTIVAQARSAGCASRQQEKSF